MTEIKFGTDGWRAIMGKDFTPDNVTRVLGAFCDEFALSANKKIYIGHDRRRHSRETAMLIATILVSRGFDPVLTSQFCPTPCVSWMTKNNNALAGIVVTASHNPANWNGIKFKENYGGAASPTYTSKIEARITLQNVDALQKNASLVDAGSIKNFIPSDGYVEQLSRLVGMKEISMAKIKAVHDPLYGAGSGYLKKIFPDLIDEIHFQDDPDFGGKNPEPVEKNLQELKEAVLHAGADLGIATDGDADRIAAFDEKGNYVSSHQIFSLLLWHHVTHRKLHGTIIKSLSTTAMVDRICQAFGLKLIETPIGFRHICHILKENDGLMGGEESGGISFRDHVHERDGLLNGLFLMEVLAVSGKKLSQVLQDLEDKFGRFYFERRDYHLDEKKMHALRNEFMQSNPELVKKLPMASSINRSDGIKLSYEDDSWILLRASGTEPLIRVYVEATSMDRVIELHHQAEKILK